MEQNLIARRSKKVKGFIRVQRNDGRFNYRKPDGTLLSKTWYYYAEDFLNGVAKVQLNVYEHLYLIDIKGKIVGQFV